MKLITRDTDYAIRALCYIAESKGDTVSASRIVKSLKIPRPFLRKILQRLNKEGLLKSHKGLGGGFTLAERVDDILIVDLIKIFQGGVRLNECVFKKKPCPNVESCPLKKKIDAIQEQVVGQLRSITIGKLLKRGR